MGVQSGRSPGEASTKQLAGNCWWEEGFRTASWRTKKSFSSWFRLLAYTTWMVHRTTWWSLLIESWSGAGFSCWIFWRPFFGDICTHTHTPKIRGRIGGKHLTHLLFPCIFSFLFRFSFATISLEQFLFSKSEKFARNLFVRCPLINWQDLLPLLRCQSSRQSASMCIFSPLKCLEAFCFGGR